MKVSDKKEEEIPKKYFIKYQKPKILLIDLPDELTNKLKSAGFNVSAGTFGSPYKVEISDKYQPVIPTPNLPNFSEQEILIIDLTPPQILDVPKGKKIRSEGETDWWAKCSFGFIDPRPYIMSEVQESFNRILNNGGVFVIFAQPHLYQNICLARKQFNRFKIEKNIGADNWSFLSILSNYLNLEIKEDYGSEIFLQDPKLNEFYFIKEALKDAQFTATIKFKYHYANDFKTILKNKYGDCVGGIFNQEYSKGKIVILPQITKIIEVVVSLINEFLPNLSPHLFPDFKKFKWIEDNEYELDTILNYKTEKIKVNQRSKEELEEIDKKILEEREKLGFLHGIITKSGDELVVSVKKCLEFIGFKKVINVDEKIDSQEGSTSKQEDLQILDKSPILLLEIKGLSGRPRESDTMQVYKYVSRRMKELGRTDVRGISIINHQRNIPPLERDNRNVFTKQQIDDANSNDINPKVIQELFYQKGIISKFPINYKPLGKVVKYWKKLSVIEVEIFDNKLHKDQRIGYVTNLGFLEEEVKSLEIKNCKITEVIPGQIVGIKTIYSKEKLVKGTNVYIVTEDSK
jgi:hypothetical protein